MEIEAASSHPLASVIRGYCLENRAKSHTASFVEETPGRGLKASFESPKGVAVIVNRRKWMSSAPPSTAGSRSLLQSWKSESKSVVLVADSPAAQVPLERNRGASSWSLRSPTGEVFARRQAEAGGRILYSRWSVRIRSAAGRSVETRGRPRIGLTLSQS